MLLIINVYRVQVIQYSVVCFMYSLYIQISVALVFMRKTERAFPHLKPIPMHYCTWNQTHMNYMEK